MWSKDDLRTLLADRIHGRTRLGPKYERAALLYARWKGLTDEAENVRSGAQTALDLLIDEMEPVDWDPLEKIVPKLGDDVFRGLLAYATRRALDQSKDRRAAVAKLKNLTRDDRDR
ncbi:conserved hypothetical protein [Hyphomicrobium sp. GJ21]|uniref:hypothetical protein n=1 Tax=Hyphomicrobium sp. GJ21 TaxID=113574 RepID=UPI00041D4398|nr:hypothetical protein [Hyphomicrobium sp. GJ21]CEJ88099.1 conserved hypothetical protein [Hyphomicrobium sp. GJ21]